MAKSARKKLMNMPASRRKKKLSEALPIIKTIEDFAMIEAYCNGAPVHAFGYTYVYGVSPNFIPGLIWQKGQKNPGKKIIPKKSWEISNNLLGSTPAREPKSNKIDDQPLLSVHLIDGDPETCWCSRGMIQPDVEPVWVRIDLPVETEVKAVRILPSKKGMRGFPPQPLNEKKDNKSIGQGLPKELIIRVSRDAYLWETVFKAKNLEEDSGHNPVEINFEPKRIKQVWIIGRVFPNVLSFGYCFSIAGVEVISSDGENLALHSRGAGVTVSSTHLGYGMDRYTQDMLWSLQYDLGFKWTRVGYDMSAFQWAYVEREKGKYEVDSRADTAITEAVEHGMEVIMVLDKGNWLYAPEPRSPKRNRDLMETYYNNPPKPDPKKNPEYFKAWLNYVRFMLRHFKDRVQYFEIWNEWNVPPEEKFLNEHVEHYCRLAEPTARLIRKEAPSAKIIIASPGGISSMHVVFLENSMLKLKGLIDVVGFHPYYNEDPEKIREYPKLIGEMRERFMRAGFRGKFMATEWSWFAPYPPTGIYEKDAFATQYQHSFSEMQKAKISARFMTANVGLGITSFWNETFQTQMISRDVSLLRNTFSADPINPTQPQPIYYVFRTLSTALEDVEPIDWGILFSSPHPDIEYYTWKKSNGDKVIAIWLAGNAVDDASREHITDIILPEKICNNAKGIDTLNGRLMDLAVSNNLKHLKGISIRDWPMIIIMSDQKKNKCDFPLATLDRNF